MCLITDETDLPPQLAIKFDVEQRGSILSWEQRRHMIHAAKTALASVPSAER
jgi:hypothetical protein